MKFRTLPDFPKEQGCHLKYKFLDIEKQNSCSRSTPVTLREEFTFSVFDHDCLEDKDLLFPEIQTVVHINKEVDSLLMRRSWE